MDPTAQAATQLAEAEKIVTGAGDRPLTPDELSQVEGHLTKAEGLRQSAELTKRIDQLNANMLGPVTRDGRPPTYGAPDTPVSIGDAFVKSAAYQALREQGVAGTSGRWTTGQIELDFNATQLGLGAKATVSETASPVVAPDFQAGIVETLLRRLTVQDLIASATTDSNQVTYAQETTATNAAAATAEEAAKPESTIILTLVNEPVRKVATFLPVSDEMLEDVAQIRGYLDARLRLFVQHAVEAQLLNGSGTAPNIRGILNRTGLQTVVTVTPLTPAKTFVAIYDGITLLRVNAFLEPDAVVIHPTNWQQIRLARDDSGGAGTGSFLGGNPFDGAGRETLWGLPAIITSAIAINTVLVGAFRAASQAFLRGGLTVEASNSHADFFSKDITALRAEQRLALSVYRPAAFVKVTLTP